MYEKFYIIIVTFMCPFFAVHDNPCGTSNGQCSSICVERPSSAATPLPLSRTCLCADTFEHVSKTGNGTNDEKCGCGETEVIVNGSCTTKTSKGPFTLSDCESEREIFLFMSLDVNSCIETKRTELFATSLSEL